MNPSLIFCFLLLFPLTLLFGQEFKKDDRIQQFKEDGHNYYRSDKLTELDLVQGLEMVGVRISKFDIGEFDRKYQLCVMVEEFLKGKIVKADTVYMGDNEYSYYTTGENKRYVDYINQIKIFTKEDSNKLTLLFDTYTTEFKKEIKYRKTNPNQFFMLRNYLNVKWKLNKKIPLMIYASSWDAGDGQRFCGVVNLSEGEELTNELLTNSPNYFLVSYKIIDIK
jgi:hypothetical protein